MAEATDATSAKPRRFRHPRAARLLGFSPASLQRRDFRDRLKIPSFMIGGRVYYDEAELRQWLERQHQLTATNGQGA